MLVSLAMVRSRWVTESFQRNARSMWILDRLHLEGVVAPRRQVEIDRVSRGRRHRDRRAPRPADREAARCGRRGRPTAASRNTGSGDRRSSPRRGGGRSPGPVHANAMNASFVPLPCPGRTGVEELPLPVAERRILQAGEQGVVERGDRRVRRLGRSPPEVHRDAHPLALRAAPGGRSAGRG